MNAPRDLQIATARYAESLVDDLMQGREVSSEHGPLVLGDVLEGEMILGDELAKLFKAPRAEKLELLDQLESRARQVVSRFVTRHCQEETAQRARDAQEDAAHAACE